MLVANRYDTYPETDFGYARNRDRYPSSDRDRSESAFLGASRYKEDVFADSSYEKARNRTSEEERSRLMNSLERRAEKTRLERSDESRYSFFAANAEAADNNFDRMWDRKHSAEGKSDKRVFDRKKLPFVIAYVVLAFAAVIGVTLSLVDFNGKSMGTARMASKGSVIFAGAENPENAEVSESEAQERKVGGETYVMLKNGEIVAIEIPEIVQKTEEKEKGFDKFCTWLNEQFGG